MSLKTSFKFSAAFKNEVAEIFNSEKIVCPKSISCIGCEHITCECFVLDDVSKKVRHDELELQVSGTIGLMNTSLRPTDVKTTCSKENHNPEN